MIKHILLSFVLLTAACSKASQAKIYKDIPFGADSKQAVDVYVPEKCGPSGCPVHVFVHGGGWVIGDKNHFTDMGEFYASQGIITVLIGYRLAPAHPHPAQVQDVAAGVKWTVDNVGRYGGNNRNMILSGHSAGAHLVALAGTDARYLGAYGLSPQIFRAVVPVDTASFDLNFKHPDQARFRERMVTNAFGESEQARELASPLYYARQGGQFPPFLLMVTSERADAVEETTRFHQALLSAGGSSVMHIEPGVSHRGMRKGMENPDSQISKLILQRLVTR